MHLSSTSIAIAALLSMSTHSCFASAPPAEGDDTNRYAPELVPTLRGNGGRSIVLPTSKSKYRYSGSSRQHHAFSVEEASGSPEIISMLKGETAAPSDGSPAGLVFQSILELAKDGTSYSDMEKAMERKGYNKQSILDILSDPVHADMKENTLHLMRGLAQKEMVDNLANEEGGSDDAFASTSIDRPDHIDTYLMEDTAEESSKDLPAFMKTSRNLRGQCELKDFADAPFPNPGRDGPGFRIQNKTPWPVEVSLWQTGPLYFELIQPGQYFYRETGAVWFTVKATINMDGKPTLDIWDAVWPPAVIVGSIALAFVTAGASTTFNASVAAAGITKASVSAAAVAKIKAWFVYLGLPAGKKLFVTAGAKAAAKTAMTATGVTMGVKEAVLSDISMNEDWSETSVGGVYAGWPWPFEGITQTIHVEGGPKFEPARVDGDCVSVFNKAESTDLKFKCKGGDCYVE